MELGCWPFAFGGLNATTSTAVVPVCAYDDAADNFATKPPLSSFRPQTLEVEGAWSAGALESVGLAYSPRSAGPAATGNLGPAQTREPARVTSGIPSGIAAPRRPS